MKQQMFINLLKHQIASLPRTEIDDIIRDQEEFIRDAVASGRNEETVINGLGTPQALGQALVAQYRIEHAQDSDKLIPKMRNTWSAVFAFMALAPLNLFFILVPFTLGILFLISVWIVDIVLILFSIGFSTFFLGKLLSFPLDINAQISIGFILVGTIAATTAFSTILVLASKLFLTRTLDYLKWNLKMMNRLGEPNDQQ